MFNKKKCKKCNKKISDSYDFCPHCGSPINPQSEDWGILGKNDILSESNNFPNQLFGGLSGKMLNKMLGGAMKMLEKEMQREIQNQNNFPKTNFELFINGKRINPRNIKVTKRPITKKPIKKQIPQINLPNEKLSGFSKLPRQEPKTNVRRFSEKVIYEIELPGVKAIKDVSITRLENSIEIKATSKEKAYFKSIPINLPITNYNLSEEKLILELETKD